MPEKRIKILYVEDNQIDQMAVQRMVNKKGLPYDIDIAGTVREVPELLEKKSYDLLLLDYLLPDGTGLDILERTKDTPCIFITGSGDEMVAVRSLKGGAYDYLIKDPERGYIEALPTTIEKVLETHRIKQEHEQYEGRIARQNEELEKLYKKTRKLSLHDPLTGLANRRLMESNLEKNLKRAVRYGTAISALMIDIDYFKNYNDTHGHPAGDSLLVDIANILRESLREVDIVARYGGEEFLVLLPDIGPEGAIHVAERIRKKIKDSTSVTVSIGVSGYSDGMDRNEFIKMADNALYQAKKSGRDRVEFCIERLKERA